MKPEDIVEETETGYVVKHGDHYHFIYKDQLNKQKPSNPIKQPDKDLPTQQTKPSQPTQPTKPDKIAGIDYRTGDGFLFDGIGIKFHTETGIVVAHGNHDHFLSYKNLIGSKFDYLVPDSARQKPHQPQPSQPDLKPKPQPTNPSKPKEPTQPNKPNQPDKDKEIEAKLVYLAEILGIKRSDLRLMQSDKGPLAIWKYGDHDHVYVLAEIEIGKEVETGHGDHPQPEKPDDSVQLTEAKRRYISETYGVPLEAIKVKDNFFVFNEPTQDYDPSHIHPYLLRRDLVELPVVTGDPETDFENELLAIAKHRNIKVSDIRIEKG